jgi:hypothetical protein
MCPRERTVETTEERLEPEQRPSAVDAIVLNILSTAIAAARRRPQKAVVRRTAE